MNNKIALESLVMDLKRVALGYHRNSLGMAQRFYEEALERKKEIDKDSLKPYVRKLLNSIDSLQYQNDKDIIAENALMLSTLLQNYVRTYPL